MADNEKTYSPQEVCAHLAKAIKEKVDAFAIELEQLRKRELKGPKTLAKNVSLCPLCGNRDIPGSCICTLAKAMPGLAKPPMPVVPKTAGMQPPTPGTPTPGSHGKPAGMVKQELCKGCGKMHPLGKCMGMGKADLPASPPPKSPPPKRSAKDIRGTPAHGIAVPEILKQPSTKKDEMGDMGDMAGGGKGVMFAEKDPGKKSVKKDEKAPGAKLPPAKGGKAAEASPGSGGGNKNGKSLSKAVSAAMASPGARPPAPVAAPAKRTIPLADLASVAKPTGRPMAPAGLPGMTPDPKAPMHPEVASSLSELRSMARPGGMHHETAQSINEAKAMSAQPPAAAPAALPGAPSRSPLLRRGGNTAERGKAPVGAKSGVTASASSADNLAADKKAGGVGWLNNLITRFRGAGTKTWESLRGAGPVKQGFGRTAAAAGALARSEAFAKSEHKALFGSCPFCKQGAHPGDCTK